MMFAPQGFMMLKGDDAQDLLALRDLHYVLLLTECCGIVPGRVHLCSLPFGPGSFRTLSHSSLAAMVAETSACVQQGW